MSDQIQHNIEDTCLTHLLHDEYRDDCSTCYSENKQIQDFLEVKCEIKNCGRSLGRKVRYGRNICDRCEEKLFG